MDNSISIIIPTYNRSRLAKRAIESVLAAISPGDEIIVIDDGSTDDTSEVLRPLFGKIRYIYTENSGLNAARDLGIRHAKCPLVALLDSDDEWLPDKIQLQRRVMDAFPHVVFCFSDLFSIHSDGEIFHHVLKIWENDPWVGSRSRERDLIEILGPGVPFSSLGPLPSGRPDFNVHIGDIYAALMEVYYVWACTILVRKNSTGDAFRFARGRHQICEDWEAFARLAKTGPAAYLDCETAIQHVHKGPRLTDVDNLVQAVERIKLLHRVWERDESFMQRHASRFYGVLKEQHLRKAKYLISEGSTQEAREELKTIGGGPWAYRLLTNLPPSVVSPLIGVRRRLKELAAKVH